MRVCAVCKLHGVRLIKGIKIFESMFKPKSTFVSEKNATKFSVLIIIIDLKSLITISAVIENLQPLCGLSLFYKVNYMYKRQVGSSPVCIYNLSFFCLHLA